MFTKDQSPPGVPTVHVTHLAGCLQSLFTTRADELALAAGFIRRRNALTGSAFLRTLCSVWNIKPDASYERLALPLALSKQSLFNRFNPNAVTFCRDVLHEALTHLVHADAATAPLLDGFDGVYLDDCTQLPLPDACAKDFPGCGSFSGAGTAGMKVFVRLELRTGGITHLALHPARAADANALDAAPDLPADSLHLADLGFADFDAMREEMGRGVFRISRLPVQTTVRLADQKEGRPLSELLARWRQQGQTRVDLEGVTVGQKHQATGRLAVLACPPDVVQKRLRKAAEDARRRCKPLSERQREMCHWQVLFGNVPPQRLSTEQLWQVYRLRWQIELLFKRFKSHGGLRGSTCAKAERVQCEWYVKLLLQLVKNWLRLLGGGPLYGVNQALLGEVVTEHARGLFAALGSSMAALQQLLEQLRQELQNLRRRTRRKSRPTVAQAFTEQTPPPTTSTPIPSLR
jgi:uncharacterized coiled-coil protein SlyX